MTIQRFEEVSNKLLPTRSISAALEDGEGEDIFHVGDPYFPAGNCYKDHIKNGERPCTSWEECKRNDERRDNEYRIAHSIRKLTKQQKKQLERYSKERKRFEDLKWGFY